MKKKFWFILGLGILIRLVLSAITFHPDLHALNFAGITVFQNGFFGLYDYLFNLSLDNPILKVYSQDLFNYPPVAYLYTVIPSLLASLVNNSIFAENYIFNFPQTLGTLALNLHLLVFKLPYLVLDIMIAILLSKLFTSPKDQLLAFTMWIFNPLTLYATFMIGQFDLIPTFLVILALYVISKTQRWKGEGVILLAALFLGIGAAFKMYPLFLLIPLASVSEKWKIRISVFIIGVLPYLLTILPFLSSPGFRATALVANQTLKSLYVQLPISGGEAILLFPASLILFYLIFLYQKIDKNLLWQRFFIILLLFFIFTHSHPQWFLWLSPFLIITLITSGFRHLFSVVLMLVSFTGLLFFFDPSLTIGLFAPLDPSLYNSISIWQIFNLNLDYNFSRSILQTIFVGSAIYLIYNYFPQNKGLKN